MSLTVTPGYTWADGDVITFTRLNTAGSVADNQTFLFAAGSAGSPSISFNAESTLGFFRYASGQIGMSGSLFAFNTAADNAFYLGQDSTHNLASVWHYNAASTSASAVLGTYSKNNPLTIQGSTLGFDSTSLANALRILASGRVIAGAAADDGVNALQTSTFGVTNTVVPIVSVSYSATTTIDFTAADYKTVTLAGNITFATSNLAAGRQSVVRIVCDTSTRNLTFPGTWIWLGSIPTTIAANKNGILSLTSYGSTDAGVIAAYSVQL
jgi:hypothetical protein